MMSDTTSACTAVTSLAAKQVNRGLNSVELLVQTIPSE